MRKTSKKTKQARRTVATRETMEGYESASVAAAMLMPSVMGELKRKLENARSYDFEEMKGYIKTLSRFIDADLASISISNLDSIRQCACWLAARAARCMVWNDAAGRVTTRAWDRARWDADGNFIGDDSDLWTADGATAEAE